MRVDKWKEKYNNLNDKQKEAVDTISGPVLVVAGPGSGKTELLAMRTANILRLTDFSPSNILLLTFTESASYNMRERLVGLIGEPAYRIGIYTFHSFATDILGKYPDCFFEGAKFSPATEVDQINIIQNIVKSLPRKNPLSSNHPELGYVYIRDIIGAIKDLKKSGLTPEDFEKVLLENKKHFKDFKNIFTSLDDIAGKRKYMEVREAYVQTYEQLKKISDKNVFKVSLVESLEFALKEASENEKSTPLTSWKNSYLEKNEADKLILKDAREDRLEKLDSLLGVYSIYQAQLHKEALFDFDDMIILVRDAIKNNFSLRAELQEKFQHILIDEFQDTNDAQFQLVKNILATNVGFENPNIFAVGDDDQAIFKFQGAQISNIMNFVNTFQNTKVIVLDKNYRSTQKILDFARNVIVKAVDRLETRDKNIRKDIKSANDNLKKIPTEVKVQKFESEVLEYKFIAEELQKLVKTVEPKEIAIICRKHDELKNLANVLNTYQIPYSYEKRENVLDKQHIHEILQILKYLHLENQGSGEELLPEILSYKFWGIERLEVWKIAEVVKNGLIHKDENEIKIWKSISWMEAMQKSSNLKIQNIATFLIDLSVKSKSTPLEVLIDEIIGTKEYLFEDSEHDDSIYSDTKNGNSREFISPYKEFYFNKKVFDHNKPQYLDFLLSLRTFIVSLREFHQGKVLYVSDVPEFLETYNGHNLTLSVISPFSSSQNAISLLTAHKSKGLEFEYVFLLGSNDSIWKKGGYASKLRFPSNLKISAENDNDDDKIRLLYVALTRCKHTLYITHTENILEYLSNDEENQKDNVSSNVNESIVETLSLTPKKDFIADERVLLLRLLENYKMPVTHLNNFLNITRVGPGKFIEQNLLRFPQAVTASSAYGSAMHATIENYFIYFNKFQKYMDQKTVEKIFESHLLRARLAKHDHDKYLEDGCENLKIYITDIKKRKILPNTKVECKFGNEGVIIGEVSATGNIDKMEFINDEIIVTDLKTGTAFDTFDEEEAKEQYEKIKVHFYKYQLAYYALLIENSNSYKKYKIKVANIEFLEAVNGKVVVLPFEITQELKERVARLANIVYKKIQNLDFPDTSKYPQNYKGIIQFENDLLESKV